jgi:hypothetical protein
MDQEQRKPSDGGSTNDTRPRATTTGRREFLGKSFGAVPIVLTLGNRRGWSGKSVHGTLWSSAGTDWKHRGGRWWRGRGWDRENPPRFKNGEGVPRRSKHDEESPPPSNRPDWDWQSSRDEWRKWRPEEVENEKPDWNWDRNETEAPVAKDVPVSPIEETIRKKE